ncbi:MAG: hypothetical protein V1837_07100 [Candidatus Woesearchaeota archaeon]
MMHTINLEKENVDKGRRLHEEMNKYFVENKIEPLSLVLRAVREDGLCRILQFGNDRTDESRLYEDCEVVLMNKLGLKPGQLTFGIYTNRPRGYEWVVNEKFKGEGIVYLALFKRGNDFKMEDNPPSKEGLMCLDEVIKQITGWERRECMFYFPETLDPKSILLGYVRVQLSETKPLDGITQLIEKLHSGEAQAKATLELKQKLPNEKAKGLIKELEAVKQYDRAAKLAKLNAINYDAGPYVRKFISKARFGDAAMILMAIGEYGFAIQMLAQEEKFGNGKNSHTTPLSEARHAEKRHNYVEAMNAYEKALAFDEAGRIAGRLGLIERQGLYDTMDKLCRNHGKMRGTS